VTAGARRAQSILSAATIAFLFVAPFAGSAGARGFLLIVAVAALVAVQARQPDLDGIPKAVLALFLAWAALAAASLGWSVQPAYTLGELRSEIVYCAGVLAVFFLAAREPSRWPRWRAALLAGSLAVVLLHLAQEWLPVSVSRHGVLGQGGLWSTHLVLIAPLVFTLGWPPPWGAGSPLLVQAVALLLLFAAAWDTGNRAVWVALAAQLAIAFVLARPAANGRGRPASLRIVALAGAAIVAAALLVSIKERVADATPGATIAAGLARDVRPHIWSVAWPKFLEAPLLGHGFGREILGDEFEKAATPEAADHPPVRHAHNLFMDMALQLGVVGLAVFVALLVLLAARYAALLRDPRAAPLGVAGLALLAGFLLKNMTDDFLHRHNALVFWALNGMLLGLARAAR